MFCFASDIVGIRLCFKFLERPLGRPRRRWKDGVRMDLREIGWGVLIEFNWLRTGTGGELL
jgi:hypothetical protein